MCMCGCVCHFLPYILQLRCIIEKNEKTQKQNAKAAIQLSISHSIRVTYVRTTYLTPTYNYLCKSTGVTKLYRSIIQFSFTRNHFYCCCHDHYDTTITTLTITTATATTTTNTTTTLSLLLLLTLPLQLYILPLPTIITAIQM